MRYLPYILVAGFLLAGCSGNQPNEDPPSPAAPLSAAGTVRFTPVEGGVWYVEIYLNDGLDGPRPAVVQTEALVDLDRGIPAELHHEGLPVVVSYEDIDDQPSTILFGNQVRIIMLLPACGPVGSG